MYTPKVIPDLEISFRSYGDAAAVAEKMLENGYVVMVSREEGLYILNAIWVEEEANRNGVTFMPRDDFDYYYCEIKSDDNDVDDKEEDSVVPMDQHCCVNESAFLTRHGFTTSSQ